VVSRLFAVAAALTLLLSLGSGPGSGAFRGPNGDILFSSQRVANDPYHLYLMRPDGTHQRRAKVGRFGNPIWSPEGRHAAYVKAPSRSQRLCLQIYVARANNMRPRRLTHDPWCSFDLAWAPDGKRIAFQRFRARQFSIWSMNANGTGLRRLTDGRASDGDPAWSPDGKTIAFVRGYPDALWLMDADGSNERQLTMPPRDPDLGPAQDSQPDWSPDGSLIAFTRAHESYEGPTGHARDRLDIFLVRPDGTGLRRLTTAPAQNRAPSWSPDGKRIVFSSTRGRGDFSHIYVMNANGTRQTRLTSGGIDHVSPKWLTRSLTARFERS
jgi:TolB protein